MTGYLIKLSIKQWESKVESTDRVVIESSIRKCLSRHFLDAEMRTILKAEAGITGEVPKARIANITAYELCKLAKMEGKVPRLIYAMLHYEGRGRAVCNCLEETFSPNGDKDLTSLRLQLQTVSNQVSISLDRVPGGGRNWTYYCRPALHRTATQSRA